MTRIELDWRPDEFAPAGIIKLSEAVVELAHALRAAGQRQRSSKDWVLSFNWCLSRRYRDPGADWVDEGPGVMAAASERSEIPPDRIEMIDGLEFAVAIPKDICEAARERLIDVAEGGTTKLILR